MVPAASSGFGVESRDSDPDELSERRVRVARQYLESAREDVRRGETGRLYFNVGTDASFDVVVERTERIERGYTLSGRIEGGAVGFTTLVVHEDAVAGSIWTPDAAYELRYLGGGVHALRDVTNAPPVDCGVGLQSELSSADATGQDRGDDGSVVDILVVYTPAAAEFAGGEPQVLSKIDHLVAYANDAFERSGAFVALNLVGAEEVDYLESYPYYDLHLLSDADGPMYGVHDRRDVLGADLVYLLANWRWHNGGQAQILGPFGVGSGDTRVFAHEVGHNMGLEHDRYQAGPITFEHGFVLDQCKGTIMAYPDRCQDQGLGRSIGQMPFYSSPWRYAPGTGTALGVPRLGIVRGPQGPADAVLAINRNRQTVANFRPSGSARLSASEVNRLAARGYGRGPATGETLSTDATTVVDIPDHALRRALETQLGKSSGEEITRGDMASVVRLSTEGVKDLTGIEWAINLVELLLKGECRSFDESCVTKKTISDLTPLADLVSLRSLNIESNEIVDITPIAGLRSLQDLDLGDNYISDISPLAQLGSLKSLVIWHNSITDLWPLAGLTSLTRLDIHGIRAKLSNSLDLPLDLSPLAQIRSLEYLRANANWISDLSPLANLTSLKELRLQGNNVNDLSPLSGLTSLTLLDLYGNDPLSDLSPLEGLTSLKRLFVGDCGTQLRDVSPLAGLTSLESLSLPGNGIVDPSPFAKLPSLRFLYLGLNNISDISPLLQNTGLGWGDEIGLDQNPLNRRSVETVIPTLRDRGVLVHYHIHIPPVPEGTEVMEIADAGLRDALLRRLRKAYSSWIGKGEIAELSGLVANNYAIEDLSGLEVATEMSRLDLVGNNVVDLGPLHDSRAARFYFLDGNDVENVGALADLSALRALTLTDNSIEDVTPLATLDTLNYLALDGNSIRDVSPLPQNLRHLHLADNEISNIAALADISLYELSLDGNAISSLAPIAGQRLRYLHMKRNQVADLAPLNVNALVELHAEDNELRDISPLLNGKELRVVDVRGNPLSEDAMGVLDELRDRETTVLAGETVPYFPAAGYGRQGFVRIVNRGDEGHVFIDAVDDAGIRVGPVRLDLGAHEAVHFNSEDLEYGNAEKGIEGIGAPTIGDWRLSVVSPLDVEVLSYVRTEDGFVTAMHDVAADAMVPFFNPGSNRNQRSILRVVNAEAEPAKWTTGGYDDRGRWRPMVGSMLVRPQHTLMLTAQALESEHGMGDGHGKWRLRVRGFPWYAMSLLESPTGHLTNLSTAPDNATVLADGRTLHRLPLFPAAGGSREGFARVVNRSRSKGEVAIEAVDDEGNRFGPVELALEGRQTVHFNSNDLEAGNAAKGLSGGVGAGSGDWRLELTSTLDLQVLSYIRTSDGFLTSMHDVAPRMDDGVRDPLTDGVRLWIPFFNPGDNPNQVSHLRLANRSDAPVEATITGIDDAGQTPGEPLQSTRWPGSVSVVIAAGATRQFTAAALETGNAEGLSGALGDGQGKWRLHVATSRDVDAMSLLSLPTGHLTNLSTTPR